MAAGPTMFLAPGPIVSRIFFLEAPNSLSAERMNSPPSVPSLRQGVWKEREAMMSGSAISQMSTVGPLRPQLQDFPDETELMLTPTNSPYSNGSYPSPSYVANCPTSMHAMDSIAPVSSVLDSLQPPMSTYSSPPVGVQYSATTADPPSPCDSAYCTSSPINASPMGSPSACSGSSTDHYAPYSCPIPITSAGGVIYNPATSTHLTLAASDNGITSGYYPALGQQVHPDTWPIPPYGVFEMPMTRSDSHPSVHEEAVPISVIDTQTHQSMVDGSIDYYPLTPSPESTEGVVPCYPNMIPSGHELSPTGFIQQSPIPYPTKRIRRPSKKPAKPPVEVDPSGIQDVPTSAQLWEFTLRVLKKPMYNYMVSWENQKEGLFRFHDAQAFAALWGKHRNRPNMTYDKVARALRYYYKRDILNQVGGRLTYRFSKRLNKLYMSSEC